MTSDQYNPMDMTGRHILVTGAASGIGREISILLSRLGAQITCLDYDERGLQESLSRLDGTVHAHYVYDLSEISGISEFLKRVVLDKGRLYGVVHAAGSQFTASLAFLTPEKWQKLMRVNAEAALALAKGFQQNTVYDGNSGSIVFISSVMGQVGSEGLAAYSMSKGALNGLTRSLALELAPRGIRVNCVAPGFVRTPMYERMIKIWDSQQRAQIESLHPLGIGQPMDVAFAVAFLLADTSRWITGTVMVVDGGYTAR